MKIIDLMLKDLWQIIKDWKAALFLLIMPIGFTLMFGFMFGGFSGGIEDPRLPVRLADRDNSDISAALVKMLSDSDVIRVDIHNSDSTNELRQDVIQGLAAGVIIIPEGFQESLYQESHSPIQVIIDPDNTAGTTIESAVRKAAGRISTALIGAKISTEFGGDLEENLQEGLKSWANPAFTVINTSIDTPDRSQAETNAFANSSPGMMMQFAIAGLIGAGEVIVKERKTRSLQRLLTTSISKAEILFGHYLAMVVMVFTQLITLVIFGEIFLRLEYFAHIGATLLISITTAMAVAGLGLLLGALAKEPDMMPVFALIPMFVFSGIGGAWVPLDVMGDAMQKISLISPVAWGMRGFQDILIRGFGMSAIWPSAAALVGFTVLFFTLAILFFKFE